MNDARGARLLSSAISRRFRRSRRARRHTHGRAPRRSLESRGRARPLRLLRRPPPLSERARIAGSRRPVPGSFPNDRARSGVVAEPGAPLSQEGPRAFFLCPFAAPPASPPARARAPDRGRPPRGRPNRRHDAASLHDDRGEHPRSQPQRARQGVPRRGLRLRVRVHEQPRDESHPRRRDRRGYARAPSRPTPLRPRVAERDGSFATLPPRRYAPRRVATRVTGASPARRPPFGSPSHPIVTRFFPPFPANAQASRTRTSRRRSRSEPPAPTWDDAPGNGGVH